MIQTRDLVHRYGDTVAVDDVSLTIDDGEFVILTGPNGSGKTTLVQHFNGLLTPEAGDVRVNRSRVGADLVAARTAIGMVFQNPRDQFVAATVGADVAFGPENLGLARQEIDRRVTDALDAVRMADRAADRIDQLSGGEQARVAIAGALAMQPDHLVLDEPFSGLDEAARQALLDRLRAVSSNGTGVIAVTHDLRGVLDLADRVYVMDDGRLVFDGPPVDAVDRLPGFGVHVP